MIINKNIIALGFVSFFTDMASSIITTLLPLYIVYILHEGIDKLGFVVAIATFISYGARFLFGYLSDRYKIVKPFVVVGYLLSALTKPLLYFTTSWQSIALLRALERVGKSIRSAPKDNMISHYSQKSQSGKTFGFHKTMDIAGEMVGAIIAFWVIYFYGSDITVFKNIFAFTLIPGLIATFIVLFFVKDIANENKKLNNFDIKDDYRIFPLLLVYFGFLFFMFNESFFIIEAKQSGIKMHYIPLLIILLTFTQTLFSYFFGLKIDRYGSTNILKLSFLFALISMIALYFDLIILSFIFLGLFLVASINALRSYISNNAINKSTVYGILYTGTAFSSALGSITTGMIWKNFGEQSAVLFSITGMIIVMLALSLKNKSV